MEQFIRDNYKNMTDKQMSEMLGCYKYRVSEKRRKMKLNRRKGIRTLDNQTETICWDCAKSTGHCVWSCKFSPINGWIAEETILKIDPRRIKAIETVSYAVISCPEFVRGRRL